MSIVSRETQRRWHDEPIDRDKETEDNHARKSSDSSKTRAETCENTAGTSLQIPQLISLTFSRSFHTLLVLSLSHLTSHLWLLYFTFLFFFFFFFFNIFLSV